MPPTSPMMGLPAYIDRINWLRSAPANARAPRRSADEARLGQLHPVPRRVLKHERLVTRQQALPTDVGNLAFDQLHLRLDQRFDLRPHRPEVVAKDGRLQHVDIKV